jgi:hypothetical protein
MMAGNVQYCLKVAQDKHLEFFFVFCFSARYSRRPECWMSITSVLPRPVNRHAKVTHLGGL